MTRRRCAAVADPIVVDVGLGARAYDIVIGRGLLATLGARVAALRPGAKVAIVTDEKVAKHHLAAAEAALEGGRRARRVVRAGRREHQELRACSQRSATRCSAARIERSDLVVALGGGVVGDLAGFAAAVVRRGIDYRAGADDAAGAGRFLGRRQDRRSTPATARTWSARSTSRSW